MFAIREAANDAGYLGISDTLSDILRVLESDQIDRTALTRELCVFIHRLRVLSELADSALSMDLVDDSMAPHISREARDVVDRLSVRGGAPADWELTSILARALGVFRISALARLSSELTMIPDWADRPGARDVVEEIRRESEVIAIEGLTISSLDMARETYDRLRDDMALLLTGSGEAVAELRNQLGQDTFGSMSPSARNDAVAYLEQPGAVLAQLQIMLPEGVPTTNDLLNRVYQERVISNRVLVDVDPDLYQFIIGVIGTPDTMIAALRALPDGADALRSCDIVMRGKVPGAPAAAAPSAPAPLRASEPPAPSAQPAPAEDWQVLFVNDAVWDQALRQKSWSQDQRDGFDALYGEPDLTSRPPSAQPAPAVDAPSNPSPPAAPPSTPLPAAPASVPAATAATTPSPPAAAGSVIPAESSDRARRRRPVQAHCGSPRP